ncbi:hypothetical protein SAMN05443428_10474 [Caloramator quimbayensis]|uniref:DUF2971 domain-containing protein n=1 Tax=Caloramator quimbayensis TaxID=1147123 RepID=A0A1T4WXB7_9CLOT|nr:hypothetical protein [Caloramator quimbayensis]SKA81525.1 hypothetical protein SAMN05443428_10474 [Caloramator quimbayensis]
MKNEEERFKEFIPYSNDIICKYMDFPEFLGFLEYKSLHFTRADKFEDEFEGKVPRSFQKYYCDFYNFRRKTYINSWSIFQSESYAMWHIYSKRYGVAVKTTVGKLSKVLLNSGAKLYKVKYVDYNKCGLNIDVPPLIINKEAAKNFFLLKPKFYEYEREIRAIVINDKELPFIDVGVNIENFIDEVIISPFADKWFTGLVRDLIYNRYNMDFVKIFCSDVEIGRV